MFKRLLLLLLFAVFMMQIAFAQTGNITGTVTNENGEPVPTANVLLVEINRGAATNLDGEYTISNVPAGTYTLRVTFVGYQEYREQVTIQPSQTLTKDMVLQEGAVGLDELVVTALGFNVRADEVGNATSRISGEEIAQAGASNLLGSLSSKAAGLNISSASGSPGAASRILIRGAVSIQGDNQPLFIIDGVPVSNSTLGVSGGGVYQQSRINDLNPNNIKSVRVLKGPAAASLWGSRAANGAIIIETKDGSLNSDFRISFKSQVKIDRINRPMDMQQKFGQGVDGEYVWGSRFSWGDKIAERPGGEDVRARPNFPYSKIIQKNSKKTYDQATRFFETGVGFDNSISLSAGDEESTIYLSIQNLNQEGIALANSNYQRTNFRANATRNFTDKFRAEVNFSYVTTNSDRIQKGSNTSGLALGAYRSPPDFNQYPYIIDYIAPDGNVIPDQQRSFRNPDGSELSSGYDNPLWSIYENLSNSEVNRILGSTELQYDISSWLSLTHRLGLDTYTDRRYAILPPGSASLPTGSFSRDVYSEYQINSDLIAEASYVINENFNGSALFGWNLNHRKFNHLYADVSDFILEDGPRSLSNGLNRFPGDYRSTQRTSALYSVINFNAFDQIFLKVTGRSESASTYGPETKNTYFYPSASVAWQFTQLDALSESSFLSFGKLRFAYGQAGVQPTVYNTQTTFTDADFGVWGPEISALSYGGGTDRSNQQGNVNLKPEITTGYDFGVDLRFFNGRVRLSVTQYYIFTKDAIFSIAVPPSTGYSSRIVNGAEIENHGTEIELSSRWIQTNNFRWTTSLYWDTNESKVTSLSGVDNVNLGGLGTVTNRVVPGAPFGVLWGSKFEKDENGELILNSNNFPVLGVQPGIIGNPTPDWTANISNTFNYRNLSLSVVVDIKHGGDVWNGTRGRMVFFGTHGSQVWETTAQQDLVNYNGEIIPKGTTFRGYVKDFGGGPVAIDQAWFIDGLGSGFNGPTGIHVEDGGYVRLREVSIQYTLNSESFSDFTGLRSINLGVTALNLALWTDYSGIDPETNLYGPSNLQGIDYFNLPGTQTFLFTLSVNY